MSGTRITLRRIAEEMVSLPPRGEFPTRLDAIDAWLDALDEITGVEGETETQDDLRRWSREIQEALFL